MRNLYKQFHWLLLPVVLSSCTARHYRKSADKEVYKIIQEKQKTALGETNAFTIDTPYSSRKPDEIKSQEIIADRTLEAKVTLSLPDALRTALENNRQFKLRKEQLYLSALTLTRDRFAYVPQFFANTTVSADRDGIGAANRAGLGTLLKTGGKVSLDLANDLLHFYTGRGGDSALSTIKLSLSQPLLRGAGAKIAAENLTQAERDVIYEIRGFSYFQDTFAFDVVTTYLRLVQQQDTVKNQYENFQSRVGLRERAVALSIDRLAPFQADLAAQEELTARNSYILAVERYRTTLDQFKITLGLPAGYDIRLDESVLKELEGVGLLPVPLTDEQSFRLSLERRPDFLNEIDIFEDSKRKIMVAADTLKPDLLLFANVASSPQERPDYATFNFHDYTLNGGIKLDLPLNRKLERNSYRATIISFERQLRALSLFLDDLKNDLRGDLRTLEQSRQSYDIQNRAKQLADRRVENSELSLQAGKVQVRDVVDAQNARVQAYNAATAALIDYHLTRMRLLLDLGVLKTVKEKFWLDYGDVPKAGVATTPAVPASNVQLITPEELFRNEKR
ncbi:MAG TPA: TolC family protein [Verrucomicrobiae bacterium]|nr:TolC family protein [Verrucomicrobiae bacterium]